MKKLLWILLTFLFFWGTNPTLAKEMVAEVGPYKLYKEDLQELMDRDSQIKELLKEKPELKNQVLKALIERWVNLSLLALAAKEAKLDEDPIIQKKFLESEKMILAEIFLQKSLAEIKISEEEIEKFYKENKDSYKIPEGVKLKHILIYVPKEAKAEEKQKALNRVKQIRAQLLKGAKFEELAKIHSDDTASREKGGDLGILRKGDTIPEFEKRVFQLKPGEISEPIHSPYGYHIVKVEKSYPAEIPPLDKIKNRVSEDLKRNKEEEYVKNLLKTLSQKYPVKIFLGESKIDGIK